jgi:hypothetical protein
MANPSRGKQEMLPLSRKCRSLGSSGRTGGPGPTWGIELLRGLGGRRLL